MTTSDSQLLAVRASHEPELRAFLCARVSFTECEDILQEVWLRFLQEKFTGGHLRGWLFTVARNLVFDTQRPPVHAQLANDDRFYREDEPVASLLEEERRTQLRGCLDKLANGFREVIEGRLRGEDTDTIAGRLQISAATVPTRYHRAVQQLQTCMGENES